MTQEHCFRAAELSMRAQALADQHKEQVLQIRAVKVQRLYLQVAEQLRDLVATHTFTPWQRSVSAVPS
jgi:hypothetical protein